MTQLLIRDLDEKIIKTLKRRAEQNNRSLQRELHLILTHAATASPEAGAARSSKAVSARRKKVALRGSVWDWLKRPAAGNLSKREIDDYIPPQPHTSDAS